MTNAFAAPTKHNTFVRVTKTGFEAVCGAGDFTSPEVTREDAQQFCEAHAANHQHGRNDAAKARVAVIADGTVFHTDGTMVEAR